MNEQLFANLGLDTTAGSFELSNGFDIETSDAIFSEDKVDDNPVKDNDTNNEESVDGNVIHLTTVIHSQQKCDRQFETHFIQKKIWFEI